jgi:hemolysin-activating ACP:hemolysin acyltransferase
VPLSSYFCEGLPSPEAASFSRDMGDIVSVLLSSPDYAHYKISTIGVWINPARRCGQIRIYYDHRGRPVGYVTWAFLTAESEQRLIMNSATLLHYSEWNEGDRLWIMDVVSPHGYGLSILKHVRDKLLADHDIFHWLRRNESGAVIRASIWRRH